MRKLTILSMSLSLLGPSACTTYDIGTKAVITSPPPAATWISKLNGGDAYVRVEATASPGPAYDRANPCSANFVPRYLDKEQTATVVVGINTDPTADSAHGNSPILVVAVSDSNSNCKKLFSDVHVSPALLLPTSAVLTSSNAYVTLAVTSTNNSNVKVGQIVSDGLAVAGAIASGGAASPFLVSATAIANGGGTSALQATVDGMVKGSQLASQQLPISLADVRSNKLHWMMPIYQKSTAPWGQTTEFADADIRVQVARSVFEGLYDPTADELRFTSSDPYKYQNTLIYDPHPTEIPTTSPQASQTGIVEPLYTYVVSHYPGNGRSTYNNDTDFLNRATTETSFQSLQNFCNNMVNSVLGTAGLALTARDRLALLWALLSPTKVWSDPQGVLGQVPNNACFGTEDYALLIAMGLTKPSAVK